MSSKLDQSLDEIAGSGRRGGRGGRRSVPRKPAAAPAGGVSKRQPAPRPAQARKPASAPTPTAPTKGDSKIIVSNLPEDVTEQQIKEYFSSTVGPVRRVLLNYTKNGRSTGVANIIFSQPNSAAEAAKSYNGVKVDNKAMKIEVVMGAQYVPEPAAAKTLKDRIATPKSAAAKPKPAGGRADAKKPAANGAPNAAAAGRNNANKKARGGRKARPVKKSAEELDADMADYFTPGTAAPAAGAAAAPAAAPNGGEAVMEDEIL